MSSDVQVFVSFKDKCVFAGEEFNCVITFKNTASSIEPLAVNASTPAASGAGGGGDAVGNGGGVTPVLGNGRLTGQTPKGHAPRRSISTSMPNRVRHQSSYSVSSPPLSLDTQRAASSGQRPFPKHQRSISIVSMSTSPVSALPESMSTQTPGQLDGRRSPLVGHRRSSTVHLTSDTAKRATLSNRQLSHDFRVTPGRRSPLSASHIPSEAKAVAPAPDFRFPMSPPDDTQPLSEPQQQTLSPRLNAQHLSVNKRPGHRTMVSTSGIPTLRDNPGIGIGIGIYNHSNHSGDTLMSEQTSMVSERAQPAVIGSTTSTATAANSTRSLQRASSVSIRKPKAATLLMGYAQVGATFTLDSSLVNQVQFEEVKKKGFLGGQAGGGVVGVKKKSRPSSGFFGGFSFGSIGESLESIIGGDNLSSVKEMRAVTSSRAIPLLSTPQSLLFVDLHLEPGEEKSYSFAYRIPKGLPSSHKGKAIRIVYTLTIGIQGAPGAKEMQAVRQISVPIRVFSGVDTDGEIFGHDLMQPYVILRDLARSKLLLPSDEDGDSPGQLDASQDMSSKDFLKYVGVLLDRNRRRQSSVGTLDITLVAAAVGGANHINSNDTTRAIDRAIFLSNQTSAATDSSPNRFEIARNGLKIATVILDRPLHRLGETITTVVDFSQSQMACTSLRSTLESGERVDPALAIRSASTISRITRKVYASQSDNVLCSKRAVFCATVPVNAAPTFVTSGVNLDWYIKLEFGTLRSPDEEISDDSDDEYAGDTAPRPAQPPVLLEEIMRDERGIVNIAVESLSCDTFEVAIPITVYGNMVSDGRDGDDVVGIPI